MKSATAFLKNKKNCLIVGLVLVPLLVLATPPSGIIYNVDLNRGTAREPISVLGHTDDWDYSLQTNLPSDFIVQHFIAAPHGYSGWHSHPGPVLITVKKGTATWYRANEPECKPVVYPTGSAFVEPAGLIHTVQNESDTENLEMFATYIVPEGVPRRTEEEKPDTCPNVP